LIFAAQVEATLLALKIGFLVLLYILIWRIVHAASRDLRLPQESMILRPHQIAGLRASQPKNAPELGRLIVAASPALPDGVVFLLDAAPLSIGRAANNDIPIGDDAYASTRHARFEPRRDGVYVEDVGSTNGTYVNGLRVTREQRLIPGDLIRIGETDLRFEP
jgi:hypothetical protein